MDMKMKTSPIISLRNLYSYLISFNGIYIKTHIYFFKLQRLLNPFSLIIYFFFLNPSKLKHYFIRGYTSAKKLALCRDYMLHRSFRTKHLFSGTNCYALR